MCIYCCCSTSSQREMMAIAYVIEISIWYTVYINSWLYWLCTLASDHKTKKSLKTPNGAISIHKSKEDRQHNGQKEKQRSTNTTQTKIEQHEHVSSYPPALPTSS